MPPPKLTLFTVSIVEWNTEQDISKYMDIALYILQCFKRHLALRLKHCRTAKKIKPTALAFFSYASLKASVSQSVSHSSQKKIPLNNFLKTM